MTGSDETVAEDAPSTLTRREAARRLFELEEELSEQL